MSLPGRLIATRPAGRRLLRALAPSAFILAVMVGGLALSNYSRFILSLAAITSIITTGLVMLVGQARIVSLASGAFAGIGAYSAAILMSELGLPYLLAGALSALLCFVLGLVLGIPSLRFRGHYLTLVTLVFQIAVVIGIREWHGITGGPRGLVYPPVGSLGLELPTMTVVYLLAFVVCAVVALCGSLLISGDFGKALTAIAGSEVASEAFAVRPDHYRVLVFGISSMLAGVGGVLLGPLMRVIDPPAFGVFESIIHVSMVVIGGMTSIWGGLIGASLLTVLPEAIRPLAEYKEVVFSGLLLLVVLTMPDGLVGRVGALARRAVRWRAPATAAEPPPDKAARARVLGHVRAHHAASGPAASGQPAPVLACEQVSKSFAGLQAVVAVDLTVEEGEIRALIGPNGAGKSTLLNLITGVEPVDAGTIRLRGEDVSRLRPSDRAMRGMTRTFQNLQLFQALSGLDNVRIGMLRFRPAQTIGRSLGTPFGRNGAGATREALGVLAGLGFRDERWSRAGDLSLGYQRRLEIARAVVSRPDLLLLDEPVAGLTDEERAGLGELLAQLVEETRLSVLVVEHTMEFVTEIADRVTAMVSGRVVAEGAPAAVLAEPVLQQAYFGA